MLRPGALLEISFLFVNSSTPIKSIHYFCDWGRQYSQVLFPAIHVYVLYIQCRTLGSQPTPSVDININKGTCTIQISHASQPHLSSNYVLYGLPQLTINTIIEPSRHLPRFCQCRYALYHMQTYPVLSPSSDIIQASRSLVISHTHTCLLLSSSSNILQLSHSRVSSYIHTSFLRPSSKIYESHALLYLGTHIHQYLAHFTTVLLSCTQAHTYTSTQPILQLSCSPVLRHTHTPVLSPFYNCHALLYLGTHIHQYLAHFTTVLLSCTQAHTYTSTQPI